MPLEKSWFPNDFLNDTGVCISVIDVRFVKNILTKESPPIMVLNIYPEVARSKFICHLYAIEFSYQFLVIQDMSQRAVLGRDILKPNYVFLMVM